MTQLRHHDSTPTAYNAVTFSRVLGRLPEHDARHDERGDGEVDVVEAATQMVGPAAVTLKTRAEYSVV